MAFSCDCFDDDFVFKDSISCIKVNMIDVNDDSKTEVNDCFKISNYNNEFISIDEYFSQAQYYGNIFQLKLEKYNAIKNSAFFEVEVFLKSNKSFSAKTDVIHFYK